MAKNKKPKTPNYGGGISTKSYKPSKKRSEGAVKAKENNIFQKLYARFMGLSKKLRVLIVAALLVAMLASVVTPIVVVAVRNYKENNFDYLESDLSDYIDLDREFYTNFPIFLDIAKPHSKNPDGSGVSDVELVILAMLAADKGNNLYGGMIPDSDIAGDGMKNGLRILPADEVYFWYRAYIVKDGNEVEITSNFYKSEEDIRLESGAYKIGGGAFPVAGIEAGLVGKNVRDYAMFEKITEGEVKDGQVAYISFTVKPVGGADADKQTRSTVRINLANDEIRSKWLSVLEGATIGEKLDDFRLTFEGVQYQYTEAKVEFVTECENGEDKPVLKVEGYAPYDFSNPELRNEQVFVDVYISGVQKRNEWHTKFSESEEYTLSYDWNDDYIKAQLAEKDHPITEEKLNEYEGETLTEKYESYIEKTILDNYKESLKAMAEDEMWSYLLARAEVIKYPASKVEKIFDEQRNALTESFDRNGGVIADPITGQSKTCETLDEYAIYYFELNYAEDQNWENYLTKYAQSLVKQRLVMYYLINEENLCSPDEFAVRLEKLKEEYVEEGIKQDGTDTSGYTDEEYEKYVDSIRNKLFNRLGDEYFRDQTYYECLLEKMLERATIYTLDDIKASDRWVFDFMSGWI